MDVFDAIERGLAFDLADAISRTKDINAYGPFGSTPLHWATNPCSKGKELDVKVEMLLKAGADPNLGDKQGCTPLYSAVRVNRMVQISLLRRYGASLHCECAYGTLIAEAVLSHQLGLIQFLSGNGVDINAISRDGFTPLMLAAGNSIPDAIPILVQNGALLDQRDREGGLTAYLHAALVGDRVAGRRLADHGADLQLTANDGSTALMLATANGHVWP